MSEKNLNALSLALYDIGAVRLGQFKLHSGRLSPIYLDLRLLASYPRLLHRATAVYRTLLDPLTYDRLAAAPLAGLPIGTAIALALEKPLIYPREKAKGYGTGKTVEGKWESGETAVVVDDVITSGDSVLRTIAALEKAGLHVNEAIVLIDREQGGRETLQARGYQLYAAIKLSQLLAILEREGRISSQQRENVLTALNA